MIRGFFVNLRQSRKKERKNKKMKTKAVIFDLDGTLLNTIYDIGDCLNHVLENHGFPKRTYDEYITFVCNGSRKLVERAADTACEREVDAILAEYKVYYSENYSVKTAPYDGIEQLLMKLSDMGVKLGVYSNKPDNIVKSLAEKHFSGIFEAVRGQTDDVPVKPAPDGAWLVANELGVDFSECVFVGDSAEDRETALNAGMIPVSVSWGYRSEKFLRECGADICVSSANELLDAILRI